MIIGIGTPSSQNNMPRPMIHLHWWRPVIRPARGKSTSPVPVRSTNMLESPTEGI